MTFPANFDDRLIFIFLSSLDLELMINARSLKIGHPKEGFHGISPYDVIRNLKFCQI